MFKQDKGRDIVILNRSKYIEKCLSLLDSNQYTEPYCDPSDSVERKGLFKGHYEKLKLPANICLKVFPTGSSHPASYMEKKKLINLVPMGKSIIYQLGQ